MPSTPNSLPKTAAAVPAVPMAEITISLLYMVFGGLWVVGTDTLVGRLLGEPPQSVSLQTLKGLNFVATTSLLLYVVLRRSFNLRRRAEEAARQDRERLELAARAATDAIWDLDIPTGTLWWSDGVEKLFGYPKTEVGTTLEFWTEQLHPDERERVAAGFHRAIEGGSSFWADESYG